VLVLVLLLAVLAGVSTWHMGWLATVPAPPPTFPTPSPSPGFQSAWTTEQEWLVDRITRDVREMAAFAATRTVPAAESDSLEALNQRPAGFLLEHSGGEPHVAVLGWGLWADRFQRNLVYSVTVDRIHTIWSVR